MTDPTYPTDISPREKELGFELIEIYVAESGFCSDSFYEGWVSVVAKVIGESDIIVKMIGLAGGPSVYAHRRFGKEDWAGSHIRNHWVLFSDAFETDPQQSIFDASFGADSHHPSKIIVAKAEIKRRQK